MVPARGDFIFIHATSPFVASNYTSIWSQHYAFSAVELGLSLVKPIAQVEKFNQDTVVS